jgi:hypothetical protein
MGAINAHTHGYRLLTEAGSESATAQVPSEKHANVHPQLMDGTSILLLRIIIRAARLAVLRRELLCDWRFRL